VVILVLAAGLRLSHLTYHSLDLDESVSVWLSAKPAGELIVNTLNLSWDPHPPGYYLMLKGWTALLGRGELVVRLLSALFGILLVGLVFLVGERLAGRWVGTIAAGLVAVNPLLVWLSQEVRMYAPAAALTLGSIYCLLRGLDERRWYWWVGYALLAAAGAYCHLFASFLLPVAALYVVIRGWRKRVLWATGLPVIAAVGISYLPFARNAWRAGSAAPEINVYPRLEVLEQLHALLQSFALRLVPQPPGWLWAPLLLLVLTLLVGLWSLAAGEVRRRGNAAGALLLAWIVVPLLAFLWANARRPAFNPKYLAPMLPAFWITVAVGIVWLARRWKWLGALSAVPTLVLAGIGWQYVWSNDALREDWRTGAAYVSARATDADTVFVHLHYARIPFEYYYDGKADVVAPLGSRPPSDESELDELLSPYAGSDVLWLVQSQEHNTDPKHVVEAWFAERGPMVTEQYPVGMSIKAFALHYRLPDRPDSALSTQIGFGTRLKLVGYQIDQSHLRPDSERLHPPSNWIHLTLYWQVQQPLDAAFESVVEMTDDGGGVWGGKLDHPRNTLSFYPPLQWQRGEVIRDDYDINLNPATPSGMYHIRIGVRSDGAFFWPVTGAAVSDERAVLADVRIENEKGR
jgi:4-amino-4-deoxy-L-arabinose transferase-like glycosyltransferase